MIEVDEKPVYLGQYKPVVWQRGRVAIPSRLMAIIRARNPDENGLLRAFLRGYHFRFLTLYGIDDLQEGDEIVDSADFKIGQNRLHIPSEVQSRVQVVGDKRAVFLGHGRYIELWSESELRRFHTMHAG